VWAAAVTPDGNWLATAGGHVGRRIRGEDQTARIMDDDTLQLRHKGATLQVWDAVSGEERANLTGHAGPVFGVAVGPDGTSMASCGDDGAVRIWDSIRWHQLWVRLF
jgi:WD40 repeat protein